MIDGLVSGRLHGHASERSGQGGSLFVTARLKATAGDGDTVIVNVIAFADKVRAALLALEDGESVALSGSLTPKVWTDKNGDTRPALDLVAHGLLSARDARP
ncbi:MULTISPECIES: single-stranded DNA-binding protein [Cupriavidus]